jgi:hypothetical protein
VKNGPAFLVHLIGLKDRAGRVKVEVYPANDTDFLADDNVLVMAGKTFRRVEVPVPAEPTPRCACACPAPALMPSPCCMTATRTANSASPTMASAFPANPRLGWSKPKANTVAVNAGGGLTTLRIVTNYRTGLFSFGPLEEGRRSSHEASPTFAPSTRPRAAACAHTSIAQLKAGAAMGHEVVAHRAGRGEPHRGTRA